MRSSQGDLGGATAAALEIHLGFSTWLRFDQSRMDLGGIVTSWSSPIMHHGRAQEQIAGVPEPLGRPLDDRVRLMDHHGRQVVPDGLAAKVRLVFFGLTHCR